MVISNKKIFCPISNTEMELWMSVPLNHATGELTEYGNIYRSQSSEYAQVIPVPEANIITSFYKRDDYYTYGYNNFSKSVNNMSFWDKLRFKIAFIFDRKNPSMTKIINSLAESKNSTICEIGCGSGELLSKLKDLGYSVQGIEPDPKAQVFNLDLNVQKGTAESLPETIKNQKYDFVIMNHVLEHCQNPLQVLTNVYDLINPNGYFICEVPNSGCLGLKFSGVAWLWLDVPRHLHFFTEKSLKGICRKVGFNVSNIYYNGYTRQFTNGWIDKEREVYDILVKSGQTIVPKPIKNSKLRAWQLLLATLLAPRNKKCDSILLVASKKLENN